MYQGFSAYEITGDIPLQETRVETPAGPCDTYEANHEIVLVPILRAVLGMVDAGDRLFRTK